MKARVTVTLKTGVLDPQGKAIEGALRSLGVEGIASVRQGKLFDIEVDDSVSDPEAALEAACQKLLANTVIENYRIAVRGAAPASRPAEPGKATESAAEAAEMPAEGHP
jgi:phosphoribosylformylglycinamidine synthase PurS subunit